MISWRGWQQLFVMSLWRYFLPLMTTKHSFLCGFGTAVAAPVGHVYPIAQLVSLAFRPHHDYGASRGTFS